MVTIQLTSAPGTVFDVVESTSSDVADIVKLCKDQWQAVHDQVNASENKLAHAFAEVDVDGKYDDELSGEVTVGLDDAIAPAVEPVVVKKATAKTKPAPKAKPTVLGKKPNKAAQVRAMVADNPGADANALMEMVKNSDIGIPNSKVKDYVIGSIKTIRG